MSKYMTPEEAAEYLDVSVRTIYRWADEGKLKAVETKDGVRVKKDSVKFRKKWLRRIKYDGLVFTFPIVTQYRYASKKYQVKTEKKGDEGWISLNKEYLKSLSKEELARQYFKPIKYHRVCLEGGYAIIVVSEQDFDRLPRAEKSKWLKFKMKWKRILEEIEK